VKHRDDRPQLGGFLQGAFRAAGYACDGTINPELSDDTAAQLIIGARSYE